MTERMARPVDDDDDEIDTVHYLNVSTPKQENADVFAKSGEDLKSLRGTSPVFKRRVSNQLKKFQRGVDGTASKQIQDKSFYSGYDTFEVVQPPYNLEYLAKLYELSAPHYAAVNAKVANIVGLGYNFVETSKTKRNLERITGNEAKLTRVRQQLDAHRDDLLDSLETFNKEDTFSEVLEKVWRDYEVTGNGYFEIGRKKDGTIGYFGHIPAQTMRIRRARDGFVQITGFDVQFFAQFGAGIDEEGNPQPITNPIGGGSPNEVIHIKKYSPTSGYYGIPDIIAAKQAVAGNEFAARFNLDYFENKAVPRHLITLKGAKLGTRAETALLSFFETGLKGQNHRSLFIPLPPDTGDNKVELKIDPIEAGTQDSSFVNYRKANLEEILMAHRVPVTKISVAAGMNLALAKDADKTFKEQVCAPEQRILEKKLNVIIKELTDAFELKLNEMTLTDADVQAKIDDIYIKNGTWLSNEVRARQGKQGIPGGNKRVDLNAKTPPAASQNNDANANRQRDTTRQANATDSRGNARNPKGEGRTPGTE